MRRTSSPALYTVALVAALSVGLTACNAGRNDAPVDPMDGTHSPDASVPGGGSDLGPRLPGSHLTGKVVAPEGTLPISGALVYITSVPPAPIPDGVYCDKCVHLPEGTAYTLTKPDGSFELDAGLGSAYLVVQKGAFRRVRTISLQSGPQPVPLAMTTLPAITDKAAGDDVPKIAVVLGAWDPIEVVLARMGLKATITKDLFDKARVLVKDAPAFAIYGAHFLGEPTPYPSPITLLTDPKEISKYHIVFIPCSGSVYNGDDPSAPRCSGVYAYDARVKTTLNEFVQKGGRLYASDWSYEYVRQVFPGALSWRGEATPIGSACMSGGGDQIVTNKDPGLDAWLSAQMQSLGSVKDAWTVLTSVNPVASVDPDGKPVRTTPKVWVQAQGAPVSASLQHGCGRVLYTTYHTQPTAQSNEPLSPQALTLLYLILEVGVCIDPPIIG
jgi:hypothetical protein